MTMQTTWDRFAGRQEPAALTRRPRAPLLLGAASVAGAAVILDRLAHAPFVRFARMTGFSIAAPDALSCQ